MKYVQIQILKYSFESISFKIYSFLSDSFYLKYLFNFNLVHQVGKIYMYRNSLFRIAHKMVSVTKEFD